MMQKINNMNLKVDTWYLNINDVVCMDLLPILNNFTRWAPPTKWRSVVSPGLPGGSRCTIAAFQHSENPSNIQTENLSIWIPKNQTHTNKTVHLKRYLKVWHGTMIADETFPLIWRWNLNTSHLSGKTEEMSFFYEQYLFWMTNIAKPQRPPLKYRNYMFCS